MEEAKRVRRELRGGMIWREMNGIDYLVRTQSSRNQKGLGPRSPETEAMYERFMSRKKELDDRIADLSKTLERHERMNRALFVGRAPKLLVNILNRLEKERLSEYFTVVGTHALYAYEATAGVTFSEAKIMETKDIDLKFDVRKRLSFVTHMNRLETSIIDILRKEDSTFQIRKSQLHTAVNSEGFEVDIIRRKTKGDDPHPLRLTDETDELYAVPARKAGILLDGPRFSEVIVSVNGRMARMYTVSPVAFANFKRWLAEQPDRDGIKRRRDFLQAEVVEALVEEYLPHLMIKEE